MFLLVAAALAHPAPLQIADDGNASGDTWTLPLSAPDVDQPHRVGGFLNSTTGLIVVVTIGAVIVIAAAIITIICARRACQRGPARADSEHYGRVILDNMDDLAYALETV
jgi:hypothetical protein